MTVKSEASKLAITSYSPVMASAIFTPATFWISVATSSARPRATRIST
jgi:hypothetical protein